VSESTGIQWTDATWNPVTGCTKVSQGCKHCYAERDWVRLSANPTAPVYFGRPFANVQTHTERLGQPLRWSKPRRIFVNSMSDLFHEDVPFEFIASVFAVMAATTRHTYQVLTKRPQRMRAFFEWVLTDDDGERLRPDDWTAGQRISDAWLKHLRWESMNQSGGVRGYDNCGPCFPYENVWLGVSVEDQKTADERIPELLATPAAKRFLSIEPMLGDVRLGSFLQRSPSAAFEAGRVTADMPAWTRIGVTAVDWVIVGGESGPRARPFDIEWARSTVRECRGAGVLVFVKQLGAHVIWNGCSSPGEHWPSGTVKDDTGNGNWRVRLRDPKGGDMSEWPEDLRVREFP
jgi:protein gp37